MGYAKSAAGSAYVLEKAAVGGTCVVDGTQILASKTAAGTKIVYAKSVSVGGKVKTALHDMHVETRSGLAVAAASSFITTTIAVRIARKKNDDEDSQQPLQTLTEIRKKDIDTEKKMFTVGQRPPPYKQ